MLSDIFLEALLGKARGNIRAAMDLAGYSLTTKTAEFVGHLRKILQCGQG